MLGDLLMGHAYRVGAGTLRFGKEKFCQPPIQPLEHDLLHRPHHIRKPFRCQFIEEAADMKILLLERSNDICRDTIIEVTDWWPEGNANRGFIQKLIQYGAPKIREEVGRRYATILRKGEIRIVINDLKCDPYEHCVWDDSRYVVRKSGNVPAVMRFNQTVGISKRCGKCTAILNSDDTHCPSCGSTTVRTIEENVVGWIGIQRFDSDTEYGVDLIRNGRAIKIGEKSAFFEYVDEFKHTIKDYSGTSGGGYTPLSQYQRNRILSDFSEGLINVVCAVDIFNEGIDVPDVNILVFQRVTHSRRIFIQQLGRGLRISDGKDKVIVLDFVSDIRRFAAGLNLKDSLEGHERSSTRIDLPNKVSFMKVGGDDPGTETFLRQWLDDVVAIEESDEDASVLKFPPLLPGGRV